MQRARSKLAFHHYRRWLGLMEGVRICLKKLFVQHHEFCGVLVIGLKVSFHPGSSKWC